MFGFSKNSSDTADATETASGTKTSSAAKTSIFSKITGFVFKPIKFVAKKAWSLVKTSAIVIAGERLVENVYEGVTGNKVNWTVDKDSGQYGVSVDNKAQALAVSDADASAIDNTTDTNVSQDSNQSNETALNSDATTQCLSSDAKAESETCENADGTTTDIEQQDNAFQPTGQNDVASSTLGSTFAQAEDAIKSTASNAIDSVSNSNQETQTASDRELPECDDVESESESDIDFDINEPSA